MQPDGNEYDTERPQPTSKPKPAAWQQGVLLRLRREHTLRLRAVPLALAVLLERILHRHLLAAQELAVEVLDRLVGRVKVVEADKAKALGLAGSGIARDLV